MLNISYIYRNHACLYELFVLSVIFPGFLEQTSADLGVGVKGWGALPDTFIILKILNVIFFEEG